MVAVIRLSSRHADRSRGNAINSYNLSRLAIAFIWIYHGLVPKLIFKHSTELELLSKGPLVGDEQTTLILAGATEVIIGILVAILWNRAWPIYISLVGFVILLAASVIVSPGHAVHAFNPITLTTSAILFCLIQISERQRSVENAG